MSKPLWRGPWLGVVAPEPTVIHGYFQAYPSAVVVNEWDVVQGSALAALLPGVAGASRLDCTAAGFKTISFSFDPDTSLFLDGNVSPTPVTGLPDNFALTNWAFNTFLRHDAFVSAVHLLIDGTEYEFPEWEPETVGGVIYQNFYLRRSIIGLFNPIDELLAMVWGMKAQFDAETLHLWTSTIGSMSLFGQYSATT